MARTLTRTPVGCHIRFGVLTDRPAHERRRMPMAATHVAEGIGAVQVPRVPTQLYIDGTWRDAADGATFDGRGAGVTRTTSRPSPRPARRTSTPRSPPRARRSTAASGRRCTAAIAGCCSTGSPTPSSATSTRSPRSRRSTSAVPRSSRKMVDLPARRRRLPALRGLGGQDRGPLGHPRAVLRDDAPGVHDPRARRRRRRDLGLERPDAHRVLEARPGARRRQRRRPQAGRGRVPVDAVHRDAHRGGRLPRPAS